MSIPTLTESQYLVLEGVHRRHGFRAALNQAFELGVGGGVALVALLTEETRERSKVGVSRQTHTSRLAALVG